MATKIENLQSLRDDLPDFSPGDTVEILYKVVEGDKERVQPFQGIVIARRGGGIDETFTVRRVLQGIGVERIFPLQSPMIKGLKVLRKGRVRRAKLYYLRKAKGKKTRVRELAPEKPKAAASKNEEK